MKYIVGLFCVLSVAVAAEKPLLDFGKAEVAAQIISNGKDGVDYQIVDGPRGKALEVTCSPSVNNFPGVTLKPATGPWDLSGCGKVEAEVTNLSDSKLTVCLRVDNAGDLWDAENTYLSAGQSATVRVYFGFSFGNRGYKLDASKISQVLVFTEKPKQPFKFRIEAVRGAGQKGDKPAGIVDRVKPAGGVLLEPGVTAVEARGAQATKVDGGMQLVFPANGKEQGVLFKAKEGTLADLSDFTQAEFALRNPGAQPLRVVCRVENKWARKDANFVGVEATLAAGAEQLVTVPFWTGAVWDGSDKKSGEKFGSDDVFGVFVGAEKSAAEQTLLVKSIKATVGPVTVLPGWVGQRPPVEGQWTKTFEDNFDGPALDQTRWTLPEKDIASIWDGNGINVARNAGLTNGCMYLKCEKPARVEVADPKLKSRQYVSTVVTTFDKFAQRYGYFEARTKVPTVLGMWPAFWMMPDRGKGNGDYWGRQDTKRGGMEIDIMEQLARFGPYRYNIAAHWDGYQKDHKSLGTERVYCMPDKDGFVTTGLLWEPGKLTFYCNGNIVGVWQNERVGSVPGYLMFTLPTGGWGTYGNIDDDNLPACFLVDYVRVWQNAAWADPKK